jgi:hypothetical protein
MPFNKVKIIRRRKISKLSKISNKDLKKFIMLA